MKEVLLMSAAKIGLMLGVTLTVVAYTVLLERKVCAWIQDRIGPNRVGPFGLLQPLADAVKLMLKEDVVPGHVIDKWLYTVAPMLVMTSALVIAGLIPWGSRLPILGREIGLVVADVDAGVVLFFAIASFSVYGIVLAGWASNSKYPLLGGLRSAAQMISYEVCLGLSLAPVFLQVGSLNLNRAVEYQIVHGWLGAWQPLSALIFFTSALAETNRTPFDLPEAEQELVGGYNTEYGSTKFAMFFLGEYAAMFAMSGLMVTLFFGGWSLPFAPLNRPATTVGVALIQVAVFLAKVGALLFVYIWIRWTIPRFRYDQLMKLGWKVLVPLSVLNLLVSALLLAAKEAR